MTTMRDRLHHGLAGRIDMVQLNGHPDQRLSNTVSLAFKDVAADRLLDRIGSLVAASAGAACHSGTVRLSHVLEAMQVPAEWARGTVRFSVGRMTTAGQIDQAVAAVAQAVTALRKKMCGTRKITHG